MVIRFLRYGPVPVVLHSMVQYIQLSFWDLLHSHGSMIHNKARSNFIADFTGLKLIFFFLSNPNKAGVVLMRGSYTFPASLKGLQVPLHYFPWITDLQLEQELVNAMLTTHSIFFFFL